MMIDPETARNLELVGNMSSKRSLHSLFGFVKVETPAYMHLLTLFLRVLNYTYTAMAARLLRVTLLSPVTGT